MEQIIDKYSDLKALYEQNKKSHNDLIIKYNECLIENRKMKKALEKPSNMFKSLVIIYFMIHRCYKYGFVNEEVMALSNLVFMVCGSMYAMFTAFEQT
jgi:hypothetical protein